MWSISKSRSEPGAIMRKDAQGWHPLATQWCYVLIYNNSCRLVSQSIEWTRWKTLFCFQKPYHSKNREKTKANTVWQTSISPCFISITELIVLWFFWSVFTRENSDCVGLGKDYQDCCFILCKQQKKIKSNTRMERNWETDLLKYSVENVVNLFL